MAFTGQLGTQRATPGNIQLGITTPASGAVGGLFTLGAGLTATRQTPAVTAPAQTLGRVSPHQRVANA